MPDHTDPDQTPEETEPNRLVISFENDETENAPEALPGVRTGGGASVSTGTMAGMSGAQSPRRSDTPTPDAYLGTCPWCSAGVDTRTAFCSSCGRASTGAPSPSGQPYPQSAAPPFPSTGPMWTTQPPMGHGPAPMGPTLQSYASTQFCPACGSQSQPGAFACTRCGSALTAFRPSKDKTVAILLAVFLSFWTWLYTFDRDQQKFWIGLGVSVGSFLLGFLLFFPFLIPIGIWIWAIVDTAQKPDTYYSRFPTG